MYTTGDESRSQFRPPWSPEIRQKRVLSLLSVGQGLSLVVVPVAVPVTERFLQGAGR
jgi:hypothetical protein